MDCFFCSEIKEYDKFGFLETEELYHCTKVLRKNIGDKIQICNGNGTFFNATIIEFDKNILKFNVISKYFIETRRQKLEIVISPTKNIDRFEFFLEKSVELGIEEITPIICEHSERKIINIERCNKILLSALKQSQNPYLPKLNKLIKFSDYLKTDFSEKDLLVAHCSTQFQRINYIKFLNSEFQKNKLAILIGPEGDFSDKEILNIIGFGAKSISLGDNRLRTETAALYSVACFKFWYESVL